MQVTTIDLDIAKNVFAGRLYSEQTKFGWCGHP